MIKKERLKMKKNYLAGYEEIGKQEKRELKRYTLKETIKQTEILLKAAKQWMK